MDNFKKMVQKNRKIIIIGFVALIAVIVIAIIAGNSVYEDIGDDYFVSDESKLVMSLKKEVANFESSEYGPEVTRIVYYCDGDKINNARVFFEYADEEEARKANENIIMDGKDWASGRKLNGKYIIFNTKKEQWNGLTVEEVKNNIEDMRAVGGLVE